jgi:lipopolysaccharide export system permease protein
MRIPWTLGRYFFGRYIKTLAWFFLGVAAIIFLVDFSENSSKIPEVVQSRMAEAFWLTALRLPLLLQQTAPFVVLFSSIITLVALNRKYELVVTRAAGISVWQFMAPFVFGAMLAGVLVTCVLNPLAALGMQIASSVEAKVGATSSSQSTNVPWLRQIIQNDDAIVGARSVGQNGTELSGVVIFHFDPQGNIVLRQDASQAILEHGYWQLNNVIETRPGEPPKRLKTAQVATNLKREFVQEQLSQPEAVGFFDLPRKIATNRALGISTSALKTQYHSLLSMPLFLIAMVMIAGTVSLKFSRLSQSPGLILGGILSGFMLYVVTMLAKAFGSSGVVPPFVAAWIPAIVALAIGATILLHQEDG